MNTNDETQKFTPEEIAELQTPPEDASLSEVDPADIDAVDAAPPEEEAEHLAPEQMVQVVESILFVATSPLSVGQLADATGMTKDRVNEAIAAISQKHAEGVSGIVLQEAGGGYRLRTALIATNWVRRFMKVRPQRLTRAAVETLAIVAYRQPVTRPEIEDVRGVDSGAVLKALLERRLVKIVGKKEEVGRPILYGTTREFLEFFALNDLKSLPTLREFHELSEEHRAKIEAAVPEKPLVVDDLAEPRSREHLAAEHAASERALEQLEEGLSQADATLRASTAALARGEDSDGRTPP